jgi:hypothetical protein
LLFVGFMAINAQTSTLSIFMPSLHAWQLAKYFTKQATLIVIPAAFCSYLAFHTASNTIGKISDALFTPEIAYSDFSKNFAAADNIVVSGHDLYFDTADNYGQTTTKTTLPPDFNHEYLLSDPEKTVSYYDALDPRNYGNEIWGALLILLLASRINVLYNDPIPRKPEEPEWSTAIHEAGHVLLGHHCEPLGRGLLDYATLLRDNKFIAHVAFGPPTPRELKRQEYIQVLAIDMAGRAAERLILGDSEINSGASENIYNATSQATHAIANTGLFGTKTIYYPAETLRENQILEARVFDQAAQMIAEAEAYALSYLRDNRNALIAVANGLMEHGTLDRDALIKIIEDNPPHPDQFEIDFGSAPAYTPEA